MARILECRHIDKTYQTGKLEVPVLHDINFSMEAGEYVAIMGPSGSGKSTLMNIIGCLDRVTAGELYLDGELVSSLSEKELALLRLRKVGFVFQTFQLLPGETALGNVELPLTYAKVPRKDRRTIATEALEKVGLGDRLNFKPSQLSGGQKQRVAIARAMVNHPKILLADEPTGALDSRSGRQVMELFRSLNREGVSVLMITHDHDIAAFADRIVEIRDGVLLDHGVMPVPEGREEEAAARVEKLLEDVSGGFFEDVEGMDADINDEELESPFDDSADAEGLLLGSIPKGPAENAKEKDELLPEEGDGEASEEAGAEAASEEAGLDAGADGASEETETDAEDGIGAFPESAGADAASLGAGVGAAAAAASLGAGAEEASGEAGADSAGAGADGDSEEAGTDAGAETLSGEGSAGPEAEAFSGEDGFGADPEEDEFGLESGELHPGYLEADEDDWDESSTDEELLESFEEPGEALDGPRMSEVPFSFEEIYAEYKKNSEAVSHDGRDASAGEDPAGESAPADLSDGSEEV